MIFNDTPLGKLTLSCGAATFPMDATEAESLLKLADTALYAAKDNGRDQCRHTNESKTLVNSVTQQDAQKGTQQINPTTPLETHTSEQEPQLVEDVAASNE